MMAIMYTESSAAQMTHYSQCWNRNYIPEQILQLCQWQRSFLREQLTNRQLSSLLRTINCQFSHWSHSRCQSNWHNSLLMNLTRLQTASRSSLKCSHLNSDLDYFLMNLFMKLILRTKMRSVMKLKKFWKSSRNKSKVSWKDLLMILTVLIHLAVLMNLIINFTKSTLNIITAVVTWTSTSILTMTFY